jgi:hypothetical protein
LNRTGGILPVDKSDGLKKPGKGNTVVKFKDAIAKSRELNMKMTEHSNTASRASQTYTATMTLYNVAADAGDEAAMQLHRDTLHTCVDTILDAGAMLSKLQKELHEIANSVTDFPTNF